MYLCVCTRCLQPFIGDSGNLMFSLAFLKTTHTERERERFLDGKMTREMNFGQAQRSSHEDSLCSSR